MTAAGARVPLVVAAFHVAGTGLTRVLRSILAPLVGAYDVHWVGLGEVQGGVTDGMRVYPGNPHGGDPYGTYQMQALIERLRPPLALVFNDLWILKNYTRVLADVRPQTRVLGCSLLDGRLIDDDLTACLPRCDRFVVCAEFARRDLRASLRRLKRQGVALPFDDVDVISYGVASETFYPVAGRVQAHFTGERRQAAKKAAFPDRPELWDGFLVLNGNRPQVRKRLDLTIEAFAAFARGKPPGVRLFLHSAVTAEQERRDVEALARRHGIVDRLATSALVEGSMRVSSRRLNLLYNACEVGINTAMGEGWGLVSFEHAATGGAQIVPRHSACEELWDGCAELLEPVERGVPDFSPLEMATVSAASAAAALERLYADEQHLERVSLACFRQATAPAYRWSRISAAWAVLFRQLLD